MGGPSRALPELEVLPLPRLELQRHGPGVIEGQEQHGDCGKALVGPLCGCDGSSLYKKKGYLRLVDWLYGNQRQDSP